MSSSIATTATTPHVHPDLEHEFDYPSPPPPVPDRRLKPAHLRTPPPTKLHSSGKGTLDSAGYSCIQKTKALPLTAIQQWIGSTSNKSPSSSLRTMSSRHYCGSIPTSSDITRTSTYSPSVRTESHSKEKSKEKRPNKTLNCLHSTADDDQERRTTCLKSSSSSLHKSKGKKQSTKVFDEATNGLAIRLPAPMTNGHDLNNRQTLSRFVFHLNWMQHENWVAWRIWSYCDATACSITMESEISRFVHCLEPFHWKITSTLEYRLQRLHDIWMVQWKVDPKSTRSVPDVRLSCWWSLACFSSSNRFDRPSTKRPSSPENDSYSLLVQYLLE